MIDLSGVALDVILDVFHYLGLSYFEFLDLLAFQLGVLKLNEPQRQLHHDLALLQVLQLVGSPLQEGNVLSSGLLLILREPTALLDLFDLRGAPSRHGTLAGVWMFSLEGVALLTRVAGQMVERVSSVELNSCRFRVRLLHSAEAEG